MRRCQRTDLGEILRQGGVWLWRNVYYVLPMWNVQCSCSRQLQLAYHQHWPAGNGAMPGGAVFTRDGGHSLGQSASQAWRHAQTQQGVLQLCPSSPANSVGRQRCSCAPRIPSACRPTAPHLVPPVQSGWASLSLAPQRLLAHFTAHQLALAAACSNCPYC